MRAVGFEDTRVTGDESRLRIFERKIYIDHHHKIFTDTILQSASKNHVPTKGGDEALNLLVADLKSLGYKQAQRRAFDAIVK